MGKFLLPNGDDVSQHAKHLVETGAFIDALDDGGEEVCGGHGGGGPRHPLVFPLQHVVKGTSWGDKDSLVI